ncbi:MAG: OmpH family outer membrane protein [Mariprofundaceae bacterium]
MNKKAILGLALAIGLLPSVIANAADSKIGYVEVKSAIENSASYKKGIKVLKAWHTKKGEEIQKSVKKIESLATELKTQSFTLSDEMKSQKTTKLKDLDKLLKRRVQDAQEELSERTAKLWEVGGAKFEKKIKEFAKKNGYDFIVTKPGVLYASPSHDITAKITKLLDQK